MRAWLRNEARVLLGTNPTRGAIASVTFLATAWLVMVALAGGLLLVALWALWDATGMWGVVGVVCAVFVVRIVWTIVSLLADDLRPPETKESGR